MGTRTAPTATPATERRAENRRYSAYLLGPSLEVLMYVFGRALRGRCRLDDSPHALRGSGACIPPASLARASLALAGALAVRESRASLALASGGCPRRTSGPSSTRGRCPSAGAWPFRDDLGRA